LTHYCTCAYFLSFAANFCVSSFHCVYITPHELWAHIAQALADHFFFLFFSGTHCVQALPVKALVLQSWAVTPEMSACPYSGSFSSLGQSPVPPLPHIPSCLTGPLIAPPKLWQICGLDGATATTMVALTVTSSFCAKWNSGTPDSRTLLDGGKMGEELVRHPGSNPGHLRGKQTP
jgi:hypothetical protein